MRSIETFQREYEPVASTQVLEGKGRIRWEHRYMNQDEARRMLQALRAAAERLEAGIAQTERG